MGIFFFIDFAKNSQLVAFSKNQGISSIFCPVFVDFTIIQCYADTVDIFGWQISEICPLYWHNLRFSRNFVKKCIFLLSFQLKSLPIARRKRLTWNSAELFQKKSSKLAWDFPTESENLISSLSPFHSKILDNGFSWEYP